MSTNSSNNTSKRKRRLTSRVRDILLVICLAISACIGVVYVADWVMAADDNRKLQNGSFEEGQTFENPDLQTATVANWKTTAFQGKFELFRDNPSTYLTNPNVRLTPTDGTYAAELNADEESTLYQVVNTSPASVYEWGLDHGARTTKDVMALVIGPSQSVMPSKPKKEGRDQFMQMVDWLNSDANSSIKAEISAIIAGKEPKHYTVYSKKFAASGAFEDNAGDNAFSLTPSIIYTEEWHIWIMASSRGNDTSVPNPWNYYGSNFKASDQNNTTSSVNFTSTSSTEENQEESATGNNDSSSIDLSKYYLYTVPAKQTKTLFGFVSISSVDKGPTFGNFLDNINFNIYHPLSGSSTIHGSAVIGGSDGSASGEGSSSGHTVTINDKLATYVTDGEALKIQAVVKNVEKDKGKKPDYDGCEFVGVYYTIQDENGNPKRQFLQLAGNIISSDGMTEQEKKESQKWFQSTNDNVDIVYTYYLNDITSATDLHFVFIKSPTVTYDPNGVKDYVVERTYNTDEAANVYSFKPAELPENNSVVDNTSGPTPDNSPTETFISPYVSKAAEGQNDGWKFMGWLLTGDTVDNIPSDVTQVNADKLGRLILPAEHTVAVDYEVKTESEGTNNKEQYFKIYNGNVTLNGNLKKSNDQITGVTWEDNGATKEYANVHKGLTMVAQWRWRQAFIPQVGSGSNYSDSDNGGTVKITSVTDTSDTNYNAAYNKNGGKSYHATTDETITATATAENGYTFEGWYDASGNLVTTNTTYSYTETKEAVNTYYARFSGSVTQTYIRQVKNGDTWVDTTDDTIGTLGRYTYTDAAGKSISSTATAGTGYKFVGWYDKNGSVVSAEMWNRSTNKIEYITSENATYYARFEKAYTVKFVSQTKQANGSFKIDTVGGKVSIASVTDVDGATASSTATANSGYKFLGWYDKNNNQLSTSTTYSTTTTSATNGVTYYERFEVDYKVTIYNKVYLSFIAESKDTQIPSVFADRDAGTEKNTTNYGLDNKFGNTISTGFKYSLNTMTDVSTIQITVSVPDTAYVKVGGTGKFTGKGTSILTDSAGVTYNKGSIQQISGATTLTYYWDAAGLEAGTKYGFIIDNLYAPGATATITVNGKEGTQVTNSNGVVNTASVEYRGKSHYPK